MTGLWVLLLIKSTLVLAAGGAVALVLRSQTAAMRHLIWLSTLGALLILPLGLLAPAAATPREWATQAMTVADSTAKAVPRAINATWMLTIWAAGFLVLLMRTAASARRSARLVRESRPAGIAANPRIRFHDTVSSPVAWSFGDGTIILPAEAMNWSSLKLQSVMRHEEAHLARRDCQALLIGELACAFCWFHPLAWFAAHRMRVEQEHAADDFVLASGMGPAEYASQLLSVATTAPREPMLAAVGTGSMLAARVRAILDTKRRRTMQTRRTVLVSFAIALAIVIPLAAMQAERKVYKVGGGVSKPQPIYKEDVKYTPEAKDEGVQGTVALAAVIETDGTVSDGRIERSLHLGLDANAVESVGRWLFRPAQKDGIAVPVSVQIEINFRLK